MCPPEARTNDDRWTRAGRFEAASLVGNHVAASATSQHQLEQVGVLNGRKENGDAASSSVFGWRRGGSLLAGWAAQGRG